MADKDELNLDLDDILREFGDLPVEQKSTQPEEMEDTIPLDDLVDALASAEEVQESTTVFATVTEDTEDFVALIEETKTFDAVTDETQDVEALIQETKAFDSVTDDTKAFVPAGNKPSMEDTVPLEEKKPEIKRLETPFRIMRRKIVEGPERQYYALRELGSMKLQTALLLSFLVAVVSVAATVLFALGRVPEDRLRLMVFSQLLMLLISAFLGAFQLVDGLFLIFKLRFRPNTLLFFTFVACCIDSIFCLQSLRVPCCTVFCLQMFMSLWGTSMHRKTELCRTDTMRGARTLTGLGVKPDYEGGVKAFLRCEGDVDDFMNTYGKDGAPEKTLGVYCFIAFLASVAVGGAVCAMKDLDFGVQVFATAMLACMPATMFITLERPAQLLEKKFYRLGVVLCGWEGIKGLAGKALFPITHKDIFPAGTVKLNGVKFYGDLDPATVVGYAATVVQWEDGSLAPIFAELKDGYNVPRCKLESFKHYAGGIGGGVDGAVVLVGTLPMLKAMDVEIPADIRMPSGIGVAVDGKFSCLVVVNYEKTRAVSHGLRVLCGYHGLKPVLISDDLMLTGPFMKKKFGVKPKKIRRPEPEARKAMRQIAVAQDERVMALAVRPSLAAYGYTIAGARALRLAIAFGVAVHILGGALGLGAVAVLAFLGEAALLTPLNILLYQAIWLIPGFLLTEWTRSI